MDEYRSRTQDSLLSNFWVNFLFLPATVTNVVQLLHCSTFFLCLTVFVSHRHFVSQSLCQWHSLPHSLSLSHILYMSHTFFLSHNFSCLCLPVSSLPFLLRFLSLTPLSISLNPNYSHTHIPTHTPQTQAQTNTQTGKCSLCWMIFKRNVIASSLSLSLRAPRQISRCLDDSLEKSVRHIDPHISI